MKLKNIFKNGLIALIIFALGCTDKSDINLRKGTFNIYDKDTVHTVIQRNENYQLEITPHLDIITLLRINWNSDREYNLTPVYPNDSSVNNVLTVTIDSVIGKSYYQSSRFEGMDSVYSSRIMMISESVSEEFLEIIKLLKEEERTNSLKQGEFKLYENDSLITKISRLNNFQIEEDIEDGSITIARLNWLSDTICILSGIEDNPEGIDTVKYKMVHFKLQNGSFRLVVKPINPDFELKDVGQLLIVKENNRVNKRHRDALIELNKRLEKSNVLN